MRICLIAPQTPFLENVSFPPLNLLYLISYLKMHGYNSVQMVDLNIAKDIPPADIYAITATTPQYPYALDLLEILDGTTIIGGAHATADPASCSMFDRVIVGDGEKAIIQCLTDIENKKNNNKHIYIGEHIENFDDLPIPERSYINSSFNKYKYFIDDAPSTIAMTSRGCPYNCFFCQKIYRNIHLHSSDYVIKELEDIRKHGYSGVYFVDDMFGLRKDLLSLQEELKNFAWKCQIRPDEKIENIKILSKLGCRAINIGIESGSQKILDTVNKQVVLEKVYDVIKECKTQNMKIRAYIIVGLPSETHETINETIEFLRNIEPDSVGIGTFVPYPGTYIYNNIEKFDIKIEELDYKKWYFRAEGDKYNCIVSTSNLTSNDILKYRNYIDKEFNR